MMVNGVRNSCEAIDTKLRCSQGQPLLLRQFLLEHRRLASEDLLAAHQFDRVVAEHHGSLRHLADFVPPLGFGNIDIGVVGSEPAHAVGQVQEAGLRLSG